MTKILLIAGLLLTSTAHANLSATPGSIFFFDEEVGSIGSSRSVSVRNHSNQPISGLSIYDNCFSDFYVSNYGCYGTLPAYGSCSLDVRFQPRLEGHHSCSIQISGSGSYTSVSVSGRGVRRDRLAVQSEAPEASAGAEDAVLESSERREWKEVLPE